MRYNSISVALVLTGLAALSCAEQAAAQVRSFHRCDLTDEQNTEAIRQIYGLPPNLKKPLPGCPGYDDDDPGYANLSIFQTKLRIPRSLMHLQRKDADGPAAFAEVNLGYPEFDPIDFVSSREDQLRISIKPFVNCHTGICTTDYDAALAGSIQARFDTRAEATGDLEEVDSDLQGFRRFKLPDLRSLYTDGPPSESVNWVLCSRHVQHYCRTWSFFPGGAVAEITFKSENIKASIAKVKEDVRTLFRSWCNCALLFED